jgi:hypothetical protein
MIIVNVKTHAEGGADPGEITVHGQRPDSNGDVDAQNDPSFVQYRFAGQAGARLRVQITDTRNGAIVYREEIQLRPGETVFDSGQRFFHL